MYETKTLYRILVVCIVVLLMTLGIYLGTEYIEKTELKDRVVDVVSEDDVKIYVDNNNSVMEKEEQQEDNANFTVTYVDVYSECGHRKEKYVNYINGDKKKITEEVEQDNIYSLVGEEDGILIFERIYQGMCGDHYKLKIENQKIVVYKINTKGKYELYQTLEIDINTIREDIKSQLEQEVVVDSLDELFIFLEDIES